MFFRKKNKINYDERFQELYKRSNKTMQEARSEVDFQIQKSLYLLVLDDYKQMIECINQGAQVDKSFVENLQKAVEKELEGLDYED